jgi:hypothetical protein
MKTFVLSAAFITTLPLMVKALPPGAYDDDADQTSRTVIHKDGTYTTTARDRHSRSLIRETKRRNDTLVMRSEFVLDQFGRESKGRVYDGQNNLLFTSEFIYNSEGKAQEERVYNAQGKLVRRLMYQYDRFGKSKPFCATYQNGRPIGDLVPLDDATALSTTSNHAYSPEAANSAGNSDVAGKLVRSRDGSTVRLNSGAVQYPGSKTDGQEARKPKRRFRIFKSRK